MIEVVGTSNTSFSDAVRGAVRRASETLDDLAWFEVAEMRGRIDPATGDIAEFQVKLDIGFRLHATKSETTPKGKSAGMTREARSAAAQRATAKTRARKAPRRDRE